MHGGGPTQVMNASLAGVVEESRLWPDVRALYGAQHGIDGVLAEKFFDLGAQPEALIAALALTPGSALGSSRSPATPDDYQRLLEILGKRGIRFLFFNGASITELQQLSTDPFGGTFFIRIQFHLAALAECFDVLAAGFGELAGRFSMRREMTEPGSRREVRG